jgi:predicted RNA-binding protein YlxR (DUF448 family)
VRIALSDAPGASARAVIDAEGTLPGRGAYLCRAPESRAARPLQACAARATRKGALTRALRAGVPIDTELIESVA